MRHIWYIHGANATPASFAYVKSQMGEHTTTDIVYDSSSPIQETIDNAIAQLSKPTHIIGHSMGGVIALALSQARPDIVQSVITVAAPFGGSEAASRVRFFLPFNSFLKNICQGNSTLKEIQRIGIVVPTLKIITIAGTSPFEAKANDGVVTVDSQSKISGGKEVVVDLNHFEPLIDQECVQLMKRFIADART